MVNLEHKLTVDDLIIEYLMAKVNGGYETSFTESEFMTFIYYFEESMPIEDVIYDAKELFKRFFERKGKSDWSRTISYHTNERVVLPHIDMRSSENDDETLFKANYKLSDYDKSVINTYFMNKKDVEKIRDIINQFLSTQNKRKINISQSVTEEESYIGKCVAAEIITNIWNSYVENLIKCHQWPSQCKNIDTYLFTIDLAPIIGLPSIKNELLEFYRETSRRIAIMFHEDKNLKISLYSNGYLAHANYKLLTKGYEKLFSIAFGPYKSSLDIDLSTQTFKESHSLPGFYEYDEDPDVATTKTNLDNPKIKEFVKVLDTNLNNNIK